MKLSKFYKVEVENKLSKQIKVLRSNRGGEYFSSEFNSFCEEYDVIHECTVPYTPQHNGIVKRKNRTFLEMVNAMLLHAKLNFNMWGEALLTVCHILNRILMKKMRYLHMSYGNKESLIWATSKCGGVLLIVRKRIQIKQNWV